MSPYLVIFIIVAYFGLLIGISYLTGKSDDNFSFFLGNKKSPWFVVAFGMVGTSLSGITFISVPGWVAESQFSYMQVVLGYLVGYTIIATVLLPLYYRLNLTSIYTYLEQRFGFWSYKTGAFFFLLSRTVGAAFRLYLVALVLQLAVFDRLGLDVPFVVTVLITIALIWLYTFRGGIRTIIWTDTLQTLFMLLAVGITVYLIAGQMQIGSGEIISQLKDSGYSQIFFFEDWNDNKHFVKQFLSGIFIAIVMTGLDQDMMQKNLSCRNLRDAQKNMFSFSIVLLIVNLCFLALGALLYMYATQQGISIPERADYLYPTIAIEGYLGISVAILFVLGLVAAAYSSADSALTALTTSVCVDFLDLGNRKKELQIKWRKYTHLLMSLVLAGVIMIFRLINDESIIKLLFDAAGFTYGPLLGLFAFGMFLKREVKDKWIPLVCLLSPIACYILKTNSVVWFNGYQFGFELLIVNGMLTFAGMLVISRTASAPTVAVKEAMASA